jgi:adenylate cyclase
MSAQIVLVVDDEIAILRLTVRILRGRGYRVLTADSVAAAEKLLVQNPVDLVLCDHYMPGEKGLSFLGRIGEQYPDMVRTLVTGNTDISLTLEFGEDARVHHCLGKPYEMQELVEFVSNLLDGKDRRQHSPDMESAVLIEEEPAQDWNWPSNGKDDRRKTPDRGDIALEDDLTRLVGA